MPKNNQKSNQIVVKQPGVIGGIRWYWWVLIGIIGFFILSSLISTLVTGGNGGGSPFKDLLTDLSKAMLGLAEGLLNLVVKSPFTYFMIAIWAFPFLGRGASAMFAAYSSKQQDKTKEEIRKEAGVDKDSLEELMKDLKEKNPGISDTDLLKASTNTTNKRVQDNLRETLQREVDAGRMEAKDANEIMKESADETKVEETGSDVEGEEKPVKDPKPIEEP